MAIDRTVGAQYAQRIIDLYAGVERELAEVIAGKLRRGLAHDDLSAKLLALTEVRRSAEAAMRKIDGKLAPAVRQALLDAAVAGGRRAQEDLLRVRDRRAVGRRLADVDKNLINSPSILRLAASLSPALERKLRATSLQVVRSAGDIYQHAVAAESAAGVLAGVTTRREATQKALDHLWDRGITGFVDRAGRNWNLASYVEMATRTTTAQAAIQAHLDQLSQQGMDLVMVSADGAPCPICRPWEGKILTTGAASGPQTVERASEVDGSAVRVHIDGSTAQAIGDGLFHPNCRHRFITYLPGLSTPIETAGEGGALYDAEQQQRKLERQARKIAVQQAGAVDPAAAKKLGQQYRAKRAEIKAHVDANAGLRRKTERERIDLGHAPTLGSRTPAPAPKPPVAPKPVKPAASKPVQPVSAHPLLDAKPRLPDRAAGSRQINAILDTVRTNPEYPKLAYTVNCVHVVNAYELRARGYDVTATPLPDAMVPENGRSVREALDRWVGADGKPHGRATDWIYQHEMLDQVDALPEGGRAWLVVGWDKGGSHIFNVERINGKIKYIDAQKGAYDFDINEYMRLSLGVGKNRAWKFIRVDDLQPTDKVMEFIK